MYERLIKKSLDYISAYRYVFMPITNLDNCKIGSESVDVKKLIKLSKEDIQVCM